VKDHLRLRAAWFRYFLLLLALAVALPAAGSDPPSVSPDEALARLRVGNGQFVAGKLKAKHVVSERKRLLKGQAPYAIVLSCSDSRVPPELVFDESLGKLFVVRVAGNVVDPVALGSIEYAAEHLHSRLLLCLATNRAAPWRLRWLAATSRPTSGASSNA